MAGEAAAKVRLTIKAKPRARRSCIVAATGLVFEARLAAPPVEGAANAELLRLLGEVLELRQSALKLVVGQASKHKVVEVLGLSATTVTERLALAVGREH